MNEYVIIAAPDSFKGSARSVDICDIIEKAALNEKKVRVVKIPLADGGEGTVEAYIAAAGGQKVKCIVTGPDFDLVEAFYGILPDGTAVIEMAQASGLSLTRIKNPLHTTTLGTGELIRDALDRGCRRFIIGIGGSATNDGGIGMAGVLGALFLDENGKFVEPTGEGLGKITEVDLENMDYRIRDSEILVACDVNNPLVGKMGAAYIYGPQKGADSIIIKRLDENLVNFAAAVSNATGKRLENIPGAGAAGGLGYGLMVFLGAKLESGIDLILEASGFDDKLDQADLVITGEGRLDEQSLMGKAISGIASRCQKKNVPVVALAGIVSVDRNQLKKSGITAAFSIQKEATDLKTAIERTNDNLLFSSEQIIHLMVGLKDKK
ncbi:MAG: glycerate kinase [Peptostreptococcaceae bacterium]|nr:glycerate kinase [Peptostreptococcaceae bacterium]